MVKHLSAGFLVGGSNPGRVNFAPPPPNRGGQQGFEPPTQGLSPPYLYPLKLDITFLRGGGGGGVKSFCSEGSKQWGRLLLSHRSLACDRGKFHSGCRAVTGDVKRLGGGYWRLEMRLGLVLGYGNAFGVESGPECWGGGGNPPLQAIPCGVGGWAHRVIFFCGKSCNFFLR